MASSASDSTRGFPTERLTSGGNGHARPLDGLISGYVFKLIRESLGLSQDGLADVLGLDKNTSKDGKADADRWLGCGPQLSSIYVTGSAVSARSRTWLGRWRQ